ncbi:hypothetical protein LCGC14_0408190 [marine sediment metagenome]|uniref:Uncharacterized protein n=2 Tax=root TaxID=1 RepID=A0A7V1BGX0_9RHOB|nr:hypothetical protein [Sulfitobacter litoralis]HDZ53039.1 hypothetical protein [Sulfitobacter litoralis]
MGIAQLSRSLLIAIALGLIFTLWVNPGTTGGLLLLLAVSTGIIYLIVSVIHLIWLGFQRSRQIRKVQDTASVVQPSFISNRGKDSPDEDERARSNDAGL